jgi:protoporphyrinogen/coproporphyrinogen III oxidase
MPSVVIVGAGISGLSLAYRLQQRARDLEITVLEQRDRPGGTMWTERRDGFQVEIGPNGFLDNKPSTLDLCRDLGLGDQLVAASEAAGRNRYLFLDGKLQRLPNSFGSFLRSGILSWRGKLGVLAERFRPRRKDAADESIDAFVRRRAGREAAEVLADAFVTGIHAGDPALLSVRATFPRLPELEMNYGSVLKGLARTAGERRARAAAGDNVPYQPGAPATGAAQRAGQMWSFREGLRLPVETLCQRLAHSPVLGLTIQRVAREPSSDSRWRVFGEGKDSWAADAVVLTCPAYEQAKLLADIDPELAEQINGIAYNKVAVVALGFRRSDVPHPLDGFGFLTPQRTRRDVLGVQWCSSIFPDRAPPGMVLSRAMCGGWNRPEMVGWEDERLLRAIAAELRVTLDIEAAPTFQQIIRWERAIPQYHLGHPERVQWIMERITTHPGLFLGGNAYHGIAVNDCTKQAANLASAVHAYLKQRG